jgi:hypothetical protein
MLPQPSGNFVSEPDLFTVSRSTAKDSREVPPLVQHADDLNLAVAHPVKDCMRCDESRPKVRHQIISLSPSQWISSNGLGRALDLPQEAVGELR